MENIRDREVFVLDCYETDALGLPPCNDIWPYQNASELMGYVMDAYGQIRRDFRADARADGDNRIIGHLLRLEILHGLRSGLMPFDGQITTGLADEIELHLLSE